jgi:hypothetical protein
VGDQEIENDLFFTFLRLLHLRVSRKFVEESVKKMHMILLHDTKEIPYLITLICKNIFYDQTTQSVT